jgi:Fe2+ transport system protein FeoA
VKSYECPLCSTDFEGATCHSNCPMSNGCDMVRCPRCGYEFVESGRVLDMLRRWIRRGPVPRGEKFRLVDLQPGEAASIVSIPTDSLARVSRLASFGIVAGTEVRLIARLPTVVLECGSTQIAVEPEIGREILVRTAH